MNASLLDVLHDAANYHGPGGVCHGVHIELEGIFEELVDEDRMLWRRIHRVGHVSVECARIVDNRHRSSPEHVRRTHHERVADGARHLARLVA